MNIQKKIFKDKKKEPNKNNRSEGSPEQSQEEQVQNKRSGRPKSQQQTVKISKEDECLWFVHPDLVQIVQYLGNSGQILLKSLSGKGPACVKKELELIDVDPDFFKMKRQEFSDALNKYQNYILKHLGYEEDKKYMFMGDNPDMVGFLNPLNQKFQLLITILDPRFVYTFECILNKNQFIAFDNKMHRMLYDWATIKELTQEGRNLLNDLQTLENVGIIENFEERINQEKDYMKSIQDSNMIPNVDIQNRIDEFVLKLRALIRQVK